MLSLSNNFGWGVSVELVEVVEVLLVGGHGGGQVAGAWPSFVALVEQGGFLDGGEVVEESA